MISRQGIVPPDGELLQVFRIEGEGEWAFYSLNESSSWAIFKIILNKGRDVKANFRICWNGERLDTGRDTFLLREHKPKLYAEISEWLATNIGELGPKQGVRKAREGIKEARTSEGVVPENAPMIGVLGGLYEVDWGVYLTGEPAEGRKSIKIVAPARIPGRANYSLDWNGKRFIRDQNFQRIAERIELLEAAENFMENWNGDVSKVTKHEPEVTTESVYAKLEGLKGGDREHTNLGDVGIINQRERDLLIYEIPEHPDYLEVRLTADEKKTDATDPFFVARVLDSGALEAIGKLYNYLSTDASEVWPRVEGLLKQHFLEKELYAGIDNGEQAE